MKALVYDAPLQFAIREILKPEVKGDQVLIKVKACGVCKTDLHIHKGEFISAFPLTPGHEFAGDVVEVGSQVTDFKIGDRVTADNTVLCGHCYFCRRNQPLFCENFYSLGCNGPGGFAEYVVVNHDKVFAISDNLAYEDAIFAEPTACAMHGLDVIDIQPGDDVLLFGAGPTGLIMAQLLKACGAANLVVAAPTMNKLKLAKTFGADHIIQVDRNRVTADDGQINKLFPKGFDVVIDATGVAAVTEQAVKYAKNGGKVVIYGVCNEEDTIRISPYEIFRRELKLIGSFAQTHCFDRALKYLGNGAVNVKGLVTDVFSLDEYGKAMQQVMNNRETIKVVIKP